MSTEAFWLTSGDSRNQNCLMSAEQIKNTSAKAIKAFDLFNVGF